MMTMLIDLDSVFTLTQSKAIPIQDFEVGKSYRMARCLGLSGDSGNGKILDIEPDSIVVKFSAQESDKAHSISLKVKDYGITWKLCYELASPPEDMSTLAKVNACYQFSFTSDSDINPQFLRNINGSDLVDCSASELRLKEIALMRYEGHLLS